MDDLRDLIKERQQALGMSETPEPLYDEPDDLSELIAERAALLKGKEEDSSILSTVGQGLVDIPVQTARGVLEMGDAVANAGRTALGMEKRYAADILPESNTVVGGLVNDVAQFGAGFTATKPLQAVNILSRVPVALNMARGAITGFLGFEGSDGNIGNLAQDLGVDNPLAVEDDDSELVARSKNAVSEVVIERALAGLGATWNALPEKTKTDMLDYLRLTFAPYYYARGEDGVVQGIKGVLRDGPPEVQEELAQAASELGSQIEESLRFYADDLDSPAAVVEATGDVTQETLARTMNTMDLDDAVDNIYEGTARQLDEPSEASIDAISGFNHARITVEEDIENLLRATTDANADVVARETQGTVTFEQTAEQARALASELGSDARVWLDELNKDVPIDQLHARITAARNALAASATQVKELARRTAAGDANAAAQLKRSILIHGALQAKVKGVQTNIARSLSAMRMLADPTMANIDITKFSNMDNVMELARTLQDAEGRALNNAVNRDLRRNWTGEIQKLYIQNLLSGMPTHVVNIAGNGVNIARVVLQKAVTAPFVDGGMREGAAMLTGLYHGLRKAPKAAYEGFRGVSKQMDLDNATTQELLQFDKTWDELGYLGKAGRSMFYTLAKVNDGFGYLSSRPLSAMDAGFRAIGESMYEGMYRSREIARLMQQELDGLPAKKRDKMLKQLRDGGDLPKHLKERVTAAADELIFVQDLGRSPDGLREGFLRDFQVFANRHPFLKAVVPFVRTPSNILKTVLRNSPAAPLSQQWRAKMLSTNPADRAEAFAQYVTGSAAMVSVMGAVEEGVITGGGPEDYAERAQKMEAGWRPYSILINGEYVSYARLDPIASIIALGADAAETAAVLEKDNADATEIFSHTLANLVGAMSEKTMVKGIGDFIEVLTEDNGETQVQKFNIYMDRMLTNVVPIVGSAALRSGNSMLGIDNPYVQDRRELGDTFFGSLPTPLRDRIEQATGKGKIYYKRGLFGEELTKGETFGPAGVSPFFSAERSDDPILAELAEIGFRRTKPPRNLKAKGADYDLSRDEYDLLQQYLGQGNGSIPKLRDLLESTMNTVKYREGSDELRLEMARLTVSSYHAVAYQLFLQDTGLFSKVMEGEIDTARKLMQGGNSTDIGWRN